ncbi:MAG: helix-turn-helix domain-containing protein [Bdellovibrionales bacterium]|nr:helix-turn-helix domain-containing protein [Bdellovibrionales bacterium]
MTQIKRASLRVAKNLRAIRRSRNLSQEQVGKMAGLPKSTINHIESGASSPSVDAVEKIALGLSISLEELMSEPDRKFEIRSAAEMPVIKSVPGLGRIIRVVPDPFEGIDLYFGEISGSGAMPGAVQRHGGRKLIFCVSGKLAVHLDGNKYLIEKNSSCLFRGDEAHSLSKVGPGTAQFFKLHLYST